VDHVLALLPFEPQALRELRGPPSTYVGHPLLERLGELRPSAPEAQRRLSDPPIVLALPGSRGNELRRLSTIFGQTLKMLAANCGPLEIVIPTFPHLKDRVTAATTDWPLEPRIVVDPQDRQVAFRNARAALTKSGTVTLELALAGIPMVAAYKVPLLDELVVRLALSLPSAILVNLILGENAVPEYLQRACTPPNLAAALLPLLTDTPQRRQQLAAFARLDAVMRPDGPSSGPPNSPSEHAAEIVLRLASRPPGAVESQSS
jgi:lipid-A-disaccharide synthase